MREMSQPELEASGNPPHPDQPMLLIFPTSDPDDPASYTPHLTGSESLDSSECALRHKYSSSPSIWPPFPE